MIVKSLECCVNWKLGLFPVWMMISSVLILATVESRGPGGVPPPKLPTGFDYSRHGFDSGGLNRYTYGSSYHWDAPTDSTLEFAMIRKEMRNMFDSARKRLKILNETLTEFIDGKVEKLIELAEGNQASLEEEIEGRKSSSEEFKKAAKNQMGEVEKKTAEVKNKLGSLKGEVKEGKNAGDSGGTGGFDLEETSKSMSAMEAKMTTLKDTAEDPNKEQKKIECKEILAESDEFF